MNGPLIVLQFEPGNELTEDVLYGKIQYYRFY